MKKREKEAVYNSTIESYEKTIVELRGEISELNKKNKDLSDQLEYYKSKSDYISSASIRAEEDIDKLKKKARLQYSLQVEKLKRFSEKWDAYFRYLKEKYPKYETVKKAVDLKEKLVILLKKKNADIVSELNKSVNSSDFIAEKPFNPKAKIQDYVAMTSENGFNLDEVLNPGELQLEDLCKELGLIE